MLNNFKFLLFALIAFVLFSTFFGNNGANSESTAQLDRILGVANTTISDFENTEGVNENNAIDKFAVKYNESLNAAEPPIHSTPLGTIARENGSLLSYADSNSNGTLDEGEEALFMMEVDSENSQLVATNREESRQSGFSGSGFLMGMMIGNMLSRQRATGTNPAARRATKKGTPSARRRSGSGSHSRGK